MTKTKRTRLQKLQNSWRKASAAERKAFVAWLGEEPAPPPTEAGCGLHGRRSAVPIATGRYVTRDTVQRLQTIMAVRGMALADVMEELGLARHDRSLARAMLRQAPLRLKTVEAIKVWLDVNADVAMAAT